MKTLFRLFKILRRRRLENLTPMQRVILLSVKESK